MSKLLENEERSEKIAGVHPELEAESRQLEMESKMNKKKQHSMSSKKAQTGDRSPVWDKAVSMLIADGIDAVSAEQAVDRVFIEDVDEIFRDIFEAIDTNNVGELRRLIARKAQMQVPLNSIDDEEDNDKEKDEEGTIEEYKEEKEEEENESRYTPEEVGLMASKYPYTAMYKNVRVAKKAKSNWFTVTNSNRPVAIIPAGRGDMVDKRAADITARHILQSIASRGLVETVKARRGRIAQAGDPGVVGGGVRDFIPLSDDTQDQSVVGRPGTDFTPERSQSLMSVTESGENIDKKEFAHAPKGLGNDVLEEQVTDMLGRRVPPGMPLNVTDREDSDMRPARPEKSVMDNVLTPRTTDMKNARRNPWLRGAQNAPPSVNVNVQRQLEEVEDTGQPSTAPVAPSAPVVAPSTSIADESDPSEVGSSAWVQEQAGIAESQQPPVTAPQSTPIENLQQMGTELKETYAPLGEALVEYGKGVIAPVQSVVEKVQDAYRGGRRNPWLKQKRAVSPPGWEKTVEEMKKHKDDIDNPWALARSMEEKGYEPGGKESRRNPWLNRKKAQLPSGGGRPLPIAEVPKGTQVAEPTLPEDKGRPLPVVRQFEPPPEGQFGELSAKNKPIQITSESFKVIVADMEKRLRDKTAKGNDTWKKAYKERFIRALLLAADRQRLNQEPCQLKVSFGDVLSDSGMEPDDIYRVVEAAFGIGSKPYADSIIRQAMQFVDMPQEAFLTIEADTKKLWPTRNAQLNDEEDEENGRDEDDVEEENGNGEELEELLENGEEEIEDEENGNDEIEARCKPKANRVQASKGNMMLAPTPNIHTGGSGRFPGLRTALRSPLTDKFPSLTKI